MMMLTEHSGDRKSSIASINTLVPIYPRPQAVAGNPAAEVRRGTVRGA